MENDDLSANDNDFMHYVLWEQIFNPVHTLNTASYVSINKVMLIVDYVRQHIFPVYWINLQAG